MSDAKKRFPFLSANWSNLVVVNYEVDPSVLQKYVPNGTELDSFNGKYFISLVAFMFTKNKFLGLIPTFPIVNFEEANLRFYIKRQDGQEEKKAVAFVREVVPSEIIAWIARTLYNEPYVKLPMSHEFTESSVDYTWGKKKEYFLRANISSETKNLVEGKFAHFILEHYWGYTPQRDGSTIEYEVEHPPWQFYELSDLQVSPELRHFYGEEFTEALSAKPHSAFMAKGSPIKVHFPNRF